MVGNTWLLTNAKISATEDVQETERGEQSGFQFKVSA